MWIHLYHFLLRAAANTPALKSSNWLAAAISALSLAAPQIFAWRKSGWSLSYWREFLKKDTVAEKVKIGVVMLLCVWGVLFFISIATETYKDHMDLVARVRELKSQPCKQGTCPQQVQVNVPPPQVTIVPSGQAYLAELDRQLANYKIGEPVEVNAQYKNFNTQLPAENTLAATYCGIVETEPVGIGGVAMVPVKAQEKAFKRFQTKLKSVKNPSPITVAPGQLHFNTTYCELFTNNDLLTNELDQQIRNPKKGKTIFYAATFSWKDATGTHANDLCLWLQPQSFPVQAWHFCEHHNGSR